MADVSYVPGPLTAVVGDQCWVLVEASPDSPAVTRIWRQFAQRAAADELLVGLLADGGGEVPGFTLLTAADGQHRMFCRGALGATVVTAAAAGDLLPGNVRAGDARASEGHAVSDRIDGTGLLTWREHVVAGAERIFLGKPPADTALRLPATSGVLLASGVVIDFTNLAGRETVSCEPQMPKDRPKKTIVFFPDTITVPPPDGDVSRAPDPVAFGQARAGDQERAAAPVPVPFAAAPVGGTGETAAAGPVAFTPPAFPGPPLPADEPAAGASDFAGGMDGTARAMNGEAVNGGHLNGDPGDEGEYDFFWGATQMRSVEGAAIRDPGNDSPLPPGQFAHDGLPMASGPWTGGLPSAPPPSVPPPAALPVPAPPSRLWRGPGDPVQRGGMRSGTPVPGATRPAAPLPGPPGGLIDVPQWLAGPGASAATVKRGDLPEPVARITPPDRIGPVVPALICPNGHVNPPSGATCRRCGAPLPHDPVPVPRPVLGVLRLSLGDVITLDRGVVMGRNPRTDFAGPDGEERPHVVKLPSADGDVSRTHLRVTLDGWHVLVTDLNSTNGTLVTLPGREPQQLRPGEPMPIQPGTVVTLAEGIDFRYEVTD